MTRQCAWCTRVLGKIEPLDDKRITHTICEKCQEDLVGSVTSRRKTIFIDGTKGERNGMFHSRKTN